MKPIFAYKYSLQNKSGIALEMTPRDVKLAQALGLPLHTGDECKPLVHLFGIYARESPSRGTPHDDSWRRNVSWRRFCLCNQGQNDKNRWGSATPQPRAGALRGACTSRLGGYAAFFVYLDSLSHIYARKKHDFFQNLKIAHELA